MKYLTSSKEKLIIISILVLFVGQEILIHSGVSEPYPSLRMSSFGGNNMTDGGYYETVSVEIAVQFSEVEEVVLAPDQFFYDAPKDYHWILTNKFKPTNQLEKSIYHPQSELLRSVFSGFFISRNRSFREFQQAPETIDWVRNQISRITPGKIPETISFRWYENQFYPGDVPNRQRDLLTSTEIAL